MMAMGLATQRRARWWAPTEVAAMTWPGWGDFTHMEARIDRGLQDFMARAWEDRTAILGVLAAIGATTASGVPDNSEDG